MDELVRGRQSAVAARRARGSGEAAARCGNRLARGGSRVNPPPAARAIKLSQQDYGGDVNPRR